MELTRAADLSAPGYAARNAAVSILSDVLRKKRPLDAAAADALAAAKLPSRDAAFARAIATTSLRRFGQLEALIRAFVPKSPPPHKAGPTLEILIAGACELLFLGVAPHAAVDAANRLAQADAKAVHFKALINAVLRRAAREGAGVVASQDAAVLNAPDWLWPRWVAQYGEATARAIGQAHLAVPPLDLTLNCQWKILTLPLREGRNSFDQREKEFRGGDKADTAPLPEVASAADAASLASTLPQGEGGRILAPGRLRLSDAGRIEELPGFATGHWWVQDFAASLPVRLLGNVKGRSVIDLCAAPGGKTAQLAAAGARVTAVDISQARLALVAENLARLKLGAELVVADARDWRAAAPADFVLLDAPCTATGTIRRHPDIPWLKSAADLSICESLQRELLDAAAAMTAEGGTLVYAVCSLEQEEGEEQIEEFLRRRTDFTRIPIAGEEVFDSSFVSPAGDLKTLPCYWSGKGGMDGFYAARLRRHSSRPNA